MKLSTLGLATIVALSAAVSVFAQPKMHFGARANLGYSSFWNTDVSYSETEVRNYDKYVVDMEISGLDDASGLGFGIGLAMLMPLAPSIYLQPEVMIASRSRSTSSLVRSVHEVHYTRDYDSYLDKPISDWTKCHTDDDVDPLGMEVELSEWFIDIPVMVRYSMPSGVFLNAGPIISLNLSADGEAGPYSLDVGDFTTTFVLGLGLGGGYSVALGGGQQLDIDVRLHFGLTALVSDDIEYLGRNIGDGTEYGNPKDFNIMIGATYWFM